MAELARSRRLSVGFFFITNIMKRRYTSKNFPLPQILVILGPTATGKSALAVRLAKKFNGEIISADSRQVYKGLNIGTGKITKKEMAGVPHHLLDVANPKTRFTVVKYQKFARRKIAEILRRHRLPIICGGTGFYIQALVDNIILPDVPPNEKLRAKLRGETTETLLSMLRKLDPARTKTVDQKNPRRIIRAIEIATALGNVPSLRSDLSSGSKVGPWDPLFIGLTLPSEELKNKIATRLFARIREGMLIEAKRLHAKGLSWKLMEELGLEYRYLSKHLKNQISKSKMVEKLQTEIWRYAKRQMTWFKRDKRIKWFQPNQTKKIKFLVKDFLS